MTKKSFFFCVFSFSFWFCLRHLFDSILHKNRKTCPRPTHCHSSNAVFRCFHFFFALDYRRRHCHYHHFTAIRFSLRFYFSFSRFSASHTLFFREKFRYICWSDDFSFIFSLSKAQQLSPLLWTTAFQLQHAQNRLSIHRCMISLGDFSLFYWVTHTHSYAERRDKECMYLVCSAEVNRKKCCTLLLL